MNLSSKNENNTVYLEKVAVSHTKQFFGNTRPETKKIATFEGDCTWTARNVGKLLVFNFGIWQQNQSVRYTKREAVKGRVWSYCSAVIQ